MRYFSNYDDLKFAEDPQPFNKYTYKEVLKYAIGANMYMPGTKEGVFEKLINNKFREIGAITLCCEDAIPEDQVENAEINIISILDKLYEKSIKEEDLMDRLPLIFIRVRNTEQFRGLAKKLNKNHVKILAGFNFPKFNSSNGNEYLNILHNLSTKYNEILYGMPILEDKSIIYKESRISELLKIKSIVGKYSKYILNIRVGGTDFSSLFGLRRSVRNSIWDIRLISDCLMDILNVFLREDFGAYEIGDEEIDEDKDTYINAGYVVSGPVWEYFSWDPNSPEIIGLKNELDLDIQNGFQGKTIIHPSQIDTVNKTYIVKYEEYVDAVNILNAIENKGGVFKSEGGNRMNEVNPHKNWAKKIVARAKIFGVADKKAVI